MDVQKIKASAFIAAGALVVGAASYLYAGSVHKPEMVAISNFGCGTAAGVGAFSVPLQTVSAGAPTMTVSYGTLELPSTNTAVRIAFDRTVDGAGREVVFVDDTLHLPVTFGRNQLKPTGIRINCKDGVVAGVRYERDRSSTTFNVVRQVES